MFDFQPRAVSCACGGELKPYKTARRTVATLHIGTFHARLKYRACGRCKRVVKPGELDRLVAPHCKFGFDVIEYVGRARFEHCQSQRAVQAALALRHVAISLREIEVLGRQFIVYLSRAHRDSQASLKQFMQMSRGGYILHLDGTCEGNSPHLMSSIDELSGIVLGNIKIPSENSDQIIPFLQDVRAAYGDPIALVHDMGTAILKSVAQVFPAVPGTVCHFHFLRDIGKDLMADPYNAIRRRLRTYNVRGTLRNMVRELKAAIDNNQEYTGSLHRYLRAGEAERQGMRPPPAVEAYLIAAWIVEAKSQGNGLGFPFDRPHFNLYQRLAHAWPALKKIKTQMPGPMASTITLPSLRRVLKDPDLSHIATLMQHRMIVFEQFREAMRIALPDTKGGLKDTGETDLQTIREKVTAFRNSRAIRHLADTDKTYGKMVRQIDKYQDKLFADPITVHCAHGSVQIQPQRTNNLMEQFFRDLKRDDRRRSGTCALARRLTAMLADAPLVKNLKSSHYMEIILNGETTVAKRFACIDRGQVRKDAKDARNAAQKYPRHMGKLFNIPDLPATLGHPNPSATEPQIQI